MLPLKSGRKQKELLLVSFFLYITMTVSQCNRSIRFRMKWFSIGKFVVLRGNNLLFIIIDGQT